MPEPRVGAGLPGVREFRSRAGSVAGTGWEQGGVQGRVWLELWRSGAGLAEASTGTQSPWALSSQRAVAAVRFKNRPAGLLSQSGRAGHEAPWLAR